jgi:hypothetical protein
MWAAAGRIFYVPRTPAKFAQRSVGPSDGKTDAVCEPWICVCYVAYRNDFSELIHVIYIT